jgi:hypothetical protein
VASPPRITTARGCSIRPARVPPSTIGTSAGRWQARS